MSLLRVRLSAENRWDDDILGYVRACSKCSEEWPLDTDYWHELAGGYPRSICRACCAEGDMERRERRKQPQEQAA